MDDGPGGGRGRSGGNGRLLRGGIGVGPPSLVPQDSRCGSLRLGEDPVVLKLFRQGLGTSFHLASQCGVGKVYQVPRSMAAPDRAEAALWVIKEISVAAVRAWLGAKSPWLSS